MFVFFFALGCVPNSILFFVLVFTFFIILPQQNQGSATLPRCKWRVPSNRYGSNRSDDRGCVFLLKCKMCEIVKICENFNVNTCHWCENVYAKKKKRNVHVQMQVRWAVLLLNSFLSYKDWELCSDVTNYHHLLCCVCLIKITSTLFGGKK